MLPFYQNIPFFSILLAMFTGVVTSLIPNGRTAARLHVIMLTLCGAANGYLALTLAQKQESFTYMLGHFPAPWGNELRAGPLEATLITAFAVVMLCCVLGGIVDILDEVEPSKQKFYFIMLDLLWSSMLVLTYTNDIFTGYVFIEINTIASCSIVMAKDNGRTCIATTQYLFTSQLGSGLFLLSISLLYGITGHLLFPGLKESVAALAATGSFRLPFTVLTGLMILGLAIKSALYPFHGWLPGAHGNATTASSAILSGLVLKGYILLLLKIFLQVYTLPVVDATHVPDVLFILGIAAMIMGSVNAIRENHLKRMIAYSSVAQIGYIYLGIGMGSEAGIAAAVLQILAHACAKPLLFITAGELSRVTGHKKQMHYLQGSAYRSPTAGVGFTVGAISMVGLPLLGGFSVKLLLANAGVTGDWHLPAAFAALAISSVLNAMYYIPTVILIWNRKRPHLVPELDIEENRLDPTDRRLLDPTMPQFVFAVAVLSLGVFALGLFYTPLSGLIYSGLALMQ